MRRFWRNEKGNMTLEAALIVPFFLIFIIFLVTMIRISLAQMALNQAVTETTDEIATHAYPAAMLANKGKGAIDQFIRDKTYDVLSYDQVKELGSQALKAAGINFSLDNALGNLSKGVVESAIQDKFSQEVGSFFKKDHLSVKEVNGLSTVASGSNAYIEIIAEYKIDLFAPFIKKDIILRKRAYERMWVGS